MKKLTIGLVLLLLLTPITTQAQVLIPGGQVIGIQLGDPLTISAFDQHSSAKEAGLQVGDRITHINNKKIDTLPLLRQAIESANGPISVRYVRNGAENTVSVRPQAGQLGIYMHKTVTGIGTVTYYDPVTGAYGALGHGINNKNGELLQNETGTVYDSRILSVQPGTAGEPGRLIGSLYADAPLGSLEKNTDRGIFGTLDTIPDKPVMETGLPQTGDAIIQCTVDGKSLQEYSVKILKIYPSDRQNGRNMLLQITDPQLLDTTKGIVQGMSGSPIIQNEKLVGAVTHVLVNDPTTGYGIFIENMLDAAA